MKKSLNMTFKNSKTFATFTILLLLNLPSHSNDEETNMMEQLTKYLVRRSFFNILYKDKFKIMYTGGRLESLTKILHRQDTDERIKKLNREQIDYTKAEARRIVEKITSKKSTKKTGRLKINDLFLPSSKNTPQNTNDFIEAWLKSIEDLFANHKWSTLADDGFLHGGFCLPVATVLPVAAVLGITPSDATSIAAAPILAVTGAGTFSFFTKWTSRSHSLLLSDVATSSSLIYTDNIRFRLLKSIFVSTCWSCVYIAAVVCAYVISYCIFENSMYRSLERSNKSIYTRSKNKKSKYAAVRALIKLELAAGISDMQTHLLNNVDPQEDLLVAKINARRNKKNRIERKITTATQSIS
jgi:hypothetical protein